MEVIGWKMEDLKNQSEFATDPDGSSRWSRRLICGGDVPVARHPGHWPDCDCEIIVIGSD